MGEMERVGLPVQRATGFGSLFPTAQQRALGRLDRQQQFESARMDAQQALDMQQMHHRAVVARTEIDVIYALGEHSMMRLQSMDEHRRSIAGNDPELNMMLANIELNTIAAAGKVQRNFGNTW